MAKQPDHIAIVALAVLIGGCATAPEKPPVSPAELRQALDERLVLAGETSLIIGDDSYRVSLSDMEARVAEAIVQVLPYDVSDRRSHGKGVGLALIDSDGQSYVLTAAHVLFHPQTRGRRGDDLLLYGSDPDVRPLILSGEQLGTRFSTLMPVLTHLDDIILFPVPDHPGVNPLPLEHIAPPDLDAVPIIANTHSLTAVSCDYLSEAHPSVCFAQTFTNFDAGRLGLYSAVTTDLDVYPGLSGSPVLAIGDNELNVMGVVVSASAEKSCPDYDPPACYTVVGPIPKDALDIARARTSLDIHPSQHVEPPADTPERSRSRSDRGWWRDY